MVCVGLHRRTAWGLLDPQARGNAPWRANAARGRRQPSQSCHHRSHTRRASRLCRFLQSGFFRRQPDRDPESLAGRHVIPWRPCRRRAGDVDLCPQARDSSSGRERPRRHGDTDRTVPRTAVEFHQRRTLRPCHLPSLGHGISRKRRAATTSEPALRSGA